MSSAFPLQASPGNGVRRFRRKPKFSFSEVHILLDEVKKNRHVVVGKFNSSVPTEVKKRKWAEITQCVNEIGESEREVNEVIKKWAELECDTKRKIASLHPCELTQAEALVSSILDLGVVLQEEAPSSHQRKSSEDQDKVEEDEVVGLGTGSGQGSPGSGHETKTMPVMHATSSLSMKCDATADAELAPIDSDDDQPATTPEKAFTREQLAQSASLSVQEQHMTNALLGTVSRSLELLAESVQQLAETQQEFARESLRLQTETVHVLREFASGALTLLHDRVNGKPPLL